jgi:hypothetical protein
MKQYKLIALTETGLSVEYTGDSIEEVKKQFSIEHVEMKEFAARIYDHFSGALLEVKPLGILAYGKA